ncbi:universal stress protein [Winogradskyella alexanderae]|uniref:Universal stress protein n=1 Tax=Winogradskyella alexanderae TaxID=2877123 RepID=A0ABS7XTN2_9FLAO|nr:universal stress protein [Winogradskyella alexanderae]MCA0132191.1 universal stress protein [Winogradskyella alexanderae]
MKRILVPVDFSDTSKNALQYAIDLYNSNALEVTVLHIYGTKSTALMMKSIDSILIKEATKEMEALISAMREKAPDVVFKTKMAKNYAVSTISELGNSGRFDMVVMGTKGVSGLKEVFMGSIAGGVVSKSSIPVIVVPLDYELKDIEKVVFAIGDDSIKDASALSSLKEIVTLHKSKLEILHISNNGLPSFDKITTAVKDLNPEFTHKKAKGDLNQQLNVHINNNDIDLLCLLRTKKDFLDRLFSGSVTLKQTFNSPVPILILHS